MVKDVHQLPHSLCIRYSPQGRLKTHWLTEDLTVLF